MSTTNLDGLRARLFAAIDGLRNGTLDIERAEAISALSQTIINSAKVQVDYLRLFDTPDRPRFLQDRAEADDPDADSTPGNNGITGIVRHTLRG